MMKSVHKSKKESIIVRGHENCGEKGQKWRENRHKMIKLDVDKSHVGYRDNNIEYQW